MEPTSKIKRTWVVQVKTPRERKLEEEYLILEKAYRELKDRYDQLCSKIKNTANDKRNADNYSLYNYGRDRGGPWN